MNINLKSVTCTGLCVILLVLKTSQFFEAACASVMGGKINFKSALLSLLKWANSFPGTMPPVCVSQVNIKSVL